MTRKAAWCGLSFLAGTFLFCTVGQYHFTASAAAAALLTALADLFLSPKYRVYAGAVGVSVLCGLSCARVYALLHISPILQLGGTVVTVEGIVTDSMALGSDRYILLVDGKADGVNAEIMFFADRECELYERVRVTGKVDVLEDTPSFPSKTYYFPMGIYLSGTADELIQTGSYGRPFMRAVSKVRSYTQKCLFAYTDADSAAFLQALICGDKSETDELTKTKLYRSGVGHLFAVSGTHIAIMAVFIEAILSLFIGSRARLKTLLLSLSVLAFAAFGGFSPSVTRAAIMVILVSCAGIAGRRTDTLSSLGICSMLMCAVNPFCCISSSFICSFAACFAIGVVSPKLTDALRGSILSVITIPLVGTLTVLTVVMPFQIILFPMVSLIAPISGLIIVPLCCAALLLTALAMLTGGTLLPSQIFLRLADFLVKAVLKLTDFFSSLEFAAVGTSRVWLVLLGAVIMGAALCFAVLNARARILAISAVGVFIGMWAVQTIADGLNTDELRLKIFMNGSSICAVVSSEGECQIMDIGAKASCNYGVQQYVSEHSIRRIRGIFIMKDLGAEQYKSAFCPEPERIYTELGSSGIAFGIGTTAELRGYSISRTEDGFDLIVGGERYVLTKNRVTLPDGGYLTAEELKKCPELVISLRDGSLRR